VKVENAALPLMIVGTAAGALEAVTGARAVADWSTKKDGTLEMSVGT
jgi:hypothetical protein